ncbi:hypothetical protein FALCPG4_012233 [Fusarium falciforme]
MSTLTMSDAPPPTATVIATTSDPRSPLLIAWDVVSAIFRFAYSFNWSLYISRLFRVLSFPFRLILIPLGFVKNVILVLLAPLFYIISYSLAGVRAVVDFLVSLEVCDVTQPREANSANLFPRSHYTPFLALLQAWASLPASPWQSAPPSSPPILECKMTIRHQSG